MGVVIVGTGVKSPTLSPLSHGARRLADAAARECLRGATHVPDAIDVLINVGVYRERGLGEPALAALIQEDVSANAGHVSPGRHGTFSFDIDNGACGVLTGADVIRGFLTSEAIKVGMVTASDSGPGPVHARDFPRPEAGGAILLTTDDDVTGLSRVQFATFPEFAGLAEGFWQWQAADGHLASRRGSNRLVVRSRPGFVERAAECAADVVKALCVREALGMRDVDLLIATPEPGFADLVADTIGIDHARTLHAGERLGRMHTTQLIAAIDYARRTGRWREARTILLVSAGAGITAAAAVYRH